MSTITIHTGKPLTQAPIGRENVILRITNLQIAKRLFAMGLLPGSTVTLIRQGPFSGTCYVKSGMITLALRQTEATAIEVT